MVELFWVESVDSCDSSFLFPRGVVSAIAGPEEAKNPAGKSPPPDSDPFDDGRALIKIPSIVNTIRRERKSPIRVPETQSAFHPHAQRNAFRRRDVRLQSRSFARWNQSLRRSPNSNRLLGIVDHLRRRFARFKLCAHLLQARSKRFNLLSAARQSGDVL